MVQFLKLFAIFPLFSVKYAHRARIDVTETTTVINGAKLLKYDRVPALLAVGLTVGRGEDPVNTLGLVLGRMLGAIDGAVLGTMVGVVDGTIDGLDDGLDDGLLVLVVDNDGDGLDDGLLVGDDDGAVVGGHALPKSIEVSLERNSPPSIITVPSNETL